MRFTGGVPEPDLEDFLDPDDPEDAKMLESIKRWKDRKSEQTVDTAEQQQD